MGERTLAACATGLTTGLAVGLLAASYQLAWLLGIKERAERLVNGHELATDAFAHSDSYVWSGEHL